MWARTSSAMLARSLDTTPMRVPREERPPELQEQLLAPLLWAQVVSVSSAVRLDMWRGTALRHRVRVKLDRAVRETLDGCKERRPLHP